MSALSEILLAVPAVLACLLGVHYLPVLGIPHYELTLTGFMLGQALLLLTLTRNLDSAYRLGSFPKVVWFFAATWVGIHLMGGVNQRLNLVPAFAAAAM